VKAILGQSEIGSDTMPAACGIERMQLLVGRSRTIEIVISSDDTDAEMAAYG
jgi:enoyl-CoA hydratase/carnithine racemase